jgi:hypothetical protein
MKITNKQNLPDALVSAIISDDYHRGDCEASTTQLISPPRKVELERLHSDQIEEDASDRIWLLMGKVAHGIIERAGSAGLQEQRLFAEIEGWRISGSFDHLALDSGTLSDFKVTSAYSVKNAADKVEWAQQLNIYAYLAQEHGLPIEKLQIVAIMRDWSKREAARDEFGTYPKQQVAVITIPLWPRDRTLAFLRERVRMHQAARVELPLCSKEDRWQRDDQWALMKKGLKRAVKLYLDRDEAEAAAAKDPDKLYVEARPGQSVRCQEYCSVSKFCSQYQNEIAANAAAA